jgi:hypothetical protein
MKKTISAVQKFAWLFAAVLLFIVVIRYVPGAIDDQGRLFGLFKLDWLDDILHMVTGLWAAFAAWHSVRQSVLYFKVIGVLYGADGFIGMVYGQNPLHIGFWTGEHVIADLGVRMLINAPHFFGGVFALFLGFYFGKKLMRPRKA